MDPALRSCQNQHPRTTLQDPPLPTNRDHKALNRGTLGGPGRGSGFLDFKLHPKIQRQMSPQGCDKPDLRPTVIPSKISSIMHAGTWSMTTHGADVREPHPLLGIRRKDDLRRRRQKHLPAITFPRCAAPTSSRTLITLHADKYKAELLFLEGP